MSSERDLIYLAGLLHDIGKFYQRADSHGASRSTILSQEIKNLEASIAPLNAKTNSYSHKHVLWTAQFFEDFRSLLQKPGQEGTAWTYDKLLRVSAAHHAPAQNALEEMIIQKADHFSSGVDRDMEGGTGWKDAEEEADRDWDSFKRTQMRSVFEGVTLRKPYGKMTYSSKLPLTAMTAGRSYFPQETVSTTDYESLWKSFTDELRTISNRSARSLNESLLFLLEKYTTRVPSSTMHLPDVSLYDHLKTTAAFALCLYDHIKYYNKSTLPSPDEKPFLLLGGSAGGIQKFIYGIVARGAAKNLKGRSFYLQLLVDNVVQTLLDELDLRHGNVVYASGGSFYIIAPNTKSIQDTVANLEKRIQEELFRQHGTDVHLVIDSIPFGESELFNNSLQGEHIGLVWAGLGERLSAKKSRRFEAILIDQYDGFFEPAQTPASKQRDAITGEPIDEEVRYLDKQGSTQPVNRSTYQMIEMGSQLKRTAYWILSREPLTYFNDNIFCIQPAGSPYYNYLVSDQERATYQEELVKSADRVRVMHFNKEDFLVTPQRGIDNVNGYFWYGGNDFPENDFKEPKTFEELAGITLDGPNYDESSKRKSGPEMVRLGILRMDVDDLGGIFRKGLAPERRSFSRYSTLSRSLDWFFRGHLNVIWKEDAEFSAYTQIIYSGGDDLFITGKWDVLISMADKIREAFRAWVCQNPDLTLSGGMSITGPRFPLLKAAAYSERFEKVAKKHAYGDRLKDAFCFLSYRPLSGEEELLLGLQWDTEFKALRSLKDQIKTLQEMPKGLSEGFSSDMYNLLQQSDMQVNSDGRYYPRNLNVIWLMAYSFKRNSEGKADEIKTFFRNWADAVMSGTFIDGLTSEKTNYHPLQFLALAARWASLEKRSKLN